VDQARDLAILDDGQRDRKSRLVEFLNYPVSALLVLWIQVQALRAIMGRPGPKRRIHNVHESFPSAYWAAMPKRRLTDPPDDLQWCVKCRKVLGDYDGWFGGQCFCHVPPPKPRAEPIGPRG
jgi:hypothetical protein